MAPMNKSSVRIPGAPPDDRAEDAFRRSREDLERRVEQRTADLEKTVNELASEVRERLAAERALGEVNEALQQEIAKHKRAEQRIRWTNAILELFVRKSTRDEYLDAVVELLKQISGCQCAGIRMLNDRGEIPYEASAGFSKEFLDQEGCLSVERDECVCTRVVLSKPCPQDEPAMTPAGSFRCNDTLKFVGAMKEEDRRAYRGACVMAGFATVGIVPIRYSGIALGAIHLADEKPEMLPDSARECIESVSPLIGEALHRFRVEEHLQVERRRLYSVLQMLPGYVVLRARDHTVRFANDKFLDLFGESRDSHCYELLRDRSQPCLYCPVSRIFETRRPGQWEWTHRDGQTFQVSGYPFFDVDGTELVLQLGIDITERKQLESEVLKAGEMERRRIGQDLHDSLGQTLSGVACLAQALHGRLRGREAAEAEEAARIRNLLAESVELTHSLARGLSPVGAGPDSLMVALKELASNVESMFGVCCVVRCDRPVTVDDALVVHQLYRIAQEAAHNAVRHGKATGIVISLEHIDGSVELKVTDDGVGMPHEPDESTGMGLRIMRYRANSVEALLTARGSPGGGTVVSCRLPQSY